MTRRMSKASKSPARKRRSRWEKRDERCSYFRTAVCPDADGHADLDFARPHRADLPVHDDAGADRERRPETVFRPRQFRHHGDPVLHPCRHLPDPRRRRAADDRVHHLAGRPFPGRSRPCRRRGLRDVRRDLGIQRRHRGGDRLDHDAGDGRARLSAPLRRRRDLDLGRARHPGAALDHPGAVRRLHQHLDRRAVHGRHRARHHSGADAGGGDLGRRLAQRLSADAERDSEAASGPRSAKASGACC